MLKVLLPTLMIGASLLFTPSARACTCSAMAEDAPIELSETDIVFVGTVVEIQDTGEHSLVTLAIEHSFQAAEEGAIQVRTGLDDADCGYPFEPDETYLVFAYQGEEGARPAVFSCGRTREISLAAGTLAALEAAVRAEGSEGVTGEAAPSSDEAAESDGASESQVSQAVPSSADLHAAPRPPKPGKGKAKGCGVASGHAGDSSLVVMLGLLGAAFVRARRRS